MIQPPSHSSQHLRADPIQPVHIIHHKEEPLVLHRHRQQVQQSRGQRQHRDFGVRVAAEDRCEHGTVLLVQPGLEVFQAESQLIQPAQGEGLLGLHPQDPHHLPAVGGRAHTHLLDQRRLADAGFPGDHHCALGVGGQYLAELGQLGVPTHQITTCGHGEIIGGTGRNRVVLLIPEAAPVI